MADSANWWDAAPVASQAPQAAPASSAQQWWANAPAVDQAAAPSAPAPDKYHQAAIDLQKKLQAAGVDTNEGLTGRYIRGRTLGAAGDITSVLTAPLEMIRHGVGPVEGYRYAKAIDDVANKEGDQKTGLAGKAMDAFGGLTTGGDAAQAGITLLKPGMGVGQAMRAMAGEGAAYGGISGFFNGGDTLADKANGALYGAGGGALLGGATPIGAKVLGSVASPAISAGRGFFNPEGMAASKLAEALANSGKSVQQVEQELSAAAAGGQGNYTVADALGNAGQRALSTVTRSPGPGRQAAVDFLENRQAGQGRRVASILADGFDAPQTAAQVTEAMKAARSSAASTNYGAARSAAGAVDVTPAIQAADSVLQPGVNSLLSNSTNIADNSIAGAVQKARSFLTDGKSQLSDFNQAHLAKQELDAMIEGASPTVQRNLIPIRNALDDALAASSQPYAAARNTFRDQSKAIEAVPMGRAAAMRGRTEDTLPAFQKLAPEGQQAFRAGYVDPLIEQTQGGAMGVNKARPFTSDAYQTELSAFAAPNRGQQMADALRRENTMFETRSHALGGSRTADNLADEAAFKLDPGFVAALLGGHWGAAARQGTAAVSNVASGALPKVREELGKLLLAGNGQVPTAISEEMWKRARTEMVANMLKSGALAARGNVLANNR